MMLDAILQDPALLTAAVVVALLLIALAVLGIMRLTASAARATAPGRRWPGPLAESLRLVLEGRPDEATELLKNALEAGADTPALYLALGALLRSSGEPERAAALHRGLTVRRGLDGAVRAEAYRQVALDLLAAGRPDEASEAAQQASALRPNDATLLALDRDCAYEAGDVDRALASHYRCVKATHTPDRRIEAALLAARADRAYREADVSAARRDIKKALKAHAGCARAKLLGARLDGDDGKPSRAAEALQSLHDEQPALDSLVLPHLATALQAAQEIGRLDAIRPAAAQAAGKPQFHCATCSTVTAEVRWRCRTCGAWL